MFNVCLKEFFTAFSLSYIYVGIQTPDPRKNTRKVSD